MNGSEQTQYEHNEAEEMAAVYQCCQRGLFHSFQADVSGVAPVNPQEELSPHTLALLLRLCLAMGDADIQRQVQEVYEKRLELGYSKGMKAVFNRMVEEEKFHLGEKSRDVRACACVFVGVRVCGRACVWVYWRV